MLSILTLAVYCIIEIIQLLKCFSMPVNVADCSLEIAARLGLQTVHALPTRSDVFLLITTRSTQPGHPSLGRRNEYQ